MSSWWAADRGREARGVVEERPLPFVVDLHAPAQLGTIPNGVDKPSVCGLRVGKIFGRDNFAVWVDDPKLSHET